MRKGVQKFQSILLCFPSKTGKLHSARNFCINRAKNQTQQDPEKGWKSPALISSHQIHGQQPPGSSQQSPSGPQVLPYLCPHLRGAACEPNLENLSKVETLIFEAGFSEGNSMVLSRGNPPWSL